MSKPRVHWVSPIPTAETDIAHYTNRILPELAETCELVLWTDASSWDRSLERICPVRQLDPDRVTPADFARMGSGQGADAIFVQIGNSWVFHAGLLRLVRRIPSIVVLHDLAIQEMSVDSIHNQLLDEDLYLDEMGHWYGAEGLKRAEAVLRGKARALDLARDMPGFQITLDRAVSVLAHTPAAYQAVQGTGALPTYLLDLPFKPSPAAPPATRAADGPLQFVQFGYIGPNRRLEQVLEALAPLAQEIDFRFWDPRYVRDRVEALGLSDRVEIHGFVPEPELDARLAQAHLVFNLRYPTMGEASGSQLRIWNASAAAVVTDLGWYGSLPDETVFKIPLEDETAALQDLVRRIACDRSLGADIATAGRARLEARHTPAIYAEAIAEVACAFPKDAQSALLARSARCAIQNARVPDLYSERLASHIDPK